MKNLVIKMSFIWLLSLVVFNSKAQIEDPVSWEMSSSHIQGNEFLLTFTAKIDEGWYVYSQYLESDDGPVRTEISFDGEHFELLGKGEEDPATRKEAFDEMFGMNVIKIRQNPNH